MLRSRRAAWLGCTLLAVSSCRAEAPSGAVVDPVATVVLPVAPAPTVEAPVAPPANEPPARRCASVKACAAAAVAALKRKDMAALAALAHPTTGVRFTPYAYVDKERDVVLSAAELRGSFDDTTRRRWGEFDGSGDPIEMSFSGYFQRFVHSGDFASVAPNYDSPPRSGNTTDNAREAYPSATVVEYCLPGNPPESGSDWSSLKLVFETVQGTPYLVGIIHSQWTI